MPLHWAGHCSSSLVDQLPSVLRSTRRTRPVVSASAGSSLVASRSAGWRGTATPAVPALRRVASSRRAASSRAGRHALIRDVSVRHEPAALIRAASTAAAAASALVRAATSATAITAAFVGLITAAAAVTAATLSVRVPGTVENNASLIQLAHAAAASERQQRCCARETTGQ